MTKTELIRQEAKKLGNVKQADIIRSLAAQGITVNSAMVSTVLKKKRRAKAVVQQARHPLTTTENTLTLDHLLKAKKLVEQFGVETVKAATDALATLSKA